VADDEREPAQLHLEITTPNKPTQLWEAVEITLPGEGGVLSILPGHTPILTTLTPGVLIAYAEDGEARFYAIHGGFAEISRNRVLVLSQLIEHRDEIDRERAEAARQRAEERLKKGGDDVEMTRAEAALKRAMARLRAHGEEHLI